MSKRSLPLLALLATAGVASAQVGTVSFIGSQTIATGSLTVGGTTVGGLSGIDYDAASGNYYLQSDARIASDGAPFGRYYTANITGLASGAFGAGAVNFTGVNSIQAPGGGAFPAAGIDPESIRYRNGSLYVASEGEASTVANQQNPFVRRYNAAGEQTQAFSVPARYNTDASATSTTGIRNNLAFESLAFSTDGLSLYTATENALKQDGPAASLTNGSNSRILRFDAATGLPTGEYVYQNSAVVQAPNPAGQFVVNGLVELLAVDSTRMLALERSFSVGAGNSVRLYEIDLAGATDVSNVASVADLTGIAPVSKRLVFDFNSIVPAAQLDNLEGITWGPNLPDGSRSLVVVSDDNFNSTVGTQFYALKVAAVPEPATFAALGLGAAALLRRRSRR